MAISYNKLLKKLIDKKMSKTEFGEFVGLSTSTVAKISKNQYISMYNLEKICLSFNCTPNDIIIL